MMNILEFAPRFSPLSQTFIYQLVRELQSREPTLRVMTNKIIDLEERPFYPVDLYPFSDSDRLLKLTHRAGFLAPITHRLPLFDGRSPSRTFQDYLREHQTDIVHAHFAHGALPIVHSCNALNIPLVISLRGFDASRLVADWRWRLAYRYIFTRCAAVITVSDEMNTRARTFVPKQVPIHTIRAGQTPRMFAFRSNPTPIRKFVSVGRLIEKKGHAVLIAALAYCRSHGADFTLEIIGDGADFESLRQLAKSLNVGREVTLLGALPHNQAMDRLARADAFVLACKTARDGDMEGIPNAVKEAQLLGIPVISTVHAGVPEAIPPSNFRWLAPEGDVKAIATRMLELAATPPGQIASMTRRGREHIEANFSLDHEVDSHLQLFKALL